jgi:CRISPR-associated protein Csb2
MPPAVAAHTRSYLSANGKDPTDKSLVFDSFLVIDRSDSCYLTWPGIEMPADEEKALTALLDGLHYLGRSESWVQAELWKGDADGPFSCEPSMQGEDAQLTTVACVQPADEFASGEWIEALTISTSTILKKRLNQPPVLKKVRYSLSEGAVVTDVGRKPVVRNLPRATAVMLGLDAKVLPLVTTTLEVAEQIRTRLMGAHSKLAGGPEYVSAVFSGKKPDGSKRMDHGHAYILPLASEDPRKEGRIDRVLIVSRKDVFDQKEMDAFRGVTKLWQADDRGDVRCVVTWEGNVDGIGERADYVESSTPFVPPRHRHKKQSVKEFLEEELRRECENHSINAQLVGVEVQGCLRGRFDAVEYRRNRKGDPVSPGYAVKLRFDRPVAAPFSLGYGAHFGLGQFQKATEER